MMVTERLWLAGLVAKSNPAVSRSAFTLAVREVVNVGASKGGLTGGGGGALGALGHRDYYILGSGGPHVRLQRLQAAWTTCESSSSPSGSARGHFRPQQSTNGSGHCHTRCLEDALDLLLQLLALLFCQDLDSLELLQPHPHLVHIGVLEGVGQWRRKGKGKDKVGFHPIRCPRSEVTGWLVIATIVCQKG